MRCQDVVMHEESCTKRLLGKWWWWLGSFCRPLLHLLSSTILIPSSMAISHNLSPSLPSLLGHLVKTLLGTTNHSLLLVAELSLASIRKKTLQLIASSCSSQSLIIGKISSSPTSNAGLNPYNSRSMDMDSRHTLMAN
jgi:hypothetical protein